MFKVTIRKILWISVGTISLVLGVLGIFLPLLPTTPFLLLTSFCYLKGSKSLHNWLIQHKIFGPIIADYVKHRTVSRRHKVTALSLLWPSLVISMYLMQNIYLWALLTSIGIMVSVHILSLKEKTKQKRTLS